ncbi:MAG: helix-turn-helix domain-containing protein [Eubacterium sp.]|nr:helix-turn-helix domain-containing protein [Eubacterium sp.]
MSNILADKLKALRKAHNYTQDYVAASLGVVRQTYSHYETGRNTPNAKTLYALSVLYQIPAHELLSLIVRLDEELMPEQRDKKEAANDFDDFLSYANDEQNKKRFHLLNYSEKELLYYFNRISTIDKREIIEFTKIKARKEVKE